MSTGGWTAHFRVTLAGSDAADHLLAVLAPESAREVPKATASLGRPSPQVVTIDVRASDPGALRAAANTYLGWVELAAGAATVARRARTAGPPAKPLSP